MAQLMNWADQLKIALEQEAQFLESYKGKKAGRIFIERSLQINKRIAYCKQKLLEIGVKYNVVHVTFFKDKFELIRNEKHFEKYEMYLTDVTMEEAKAIVKFREPKAWAIQVQNILPGISSTVK